MGCLSTSGSAVHPRGCGERPLMDGVEVQCRGSSPRVRGTEMELRQAETVYRFIPAGAGNGVQLELWTQTLPVHPRGCGERLCYQAPDFGCHGSSPRVRGTVKFYKAGAVWHRFIPAGAGNGSKGHPQQQSGTVHPRGCGERLVSNHPGVVGGGSSPRVRGTGSLT